MALDLDKREFMLGIFQIHKCLKMFKKNLQTNLNLLPEYQKIPSNPLISTKIKKTSDVLLLLNSLKFE